MAPAEAVAAASAGSDACACTCDSVAAAAAVVGDADGSGDFPEGAFKNDNAVVVAAAIPDEGRGVVHVAFLSAVMA